MENNDQTTKLGRQVLSIISAVAILALLALINLKLTVEAKRQARADSLALVAQDSTDVEMFFEQRIRDDTTLLDHSRIDTERIDGVQQPGNSFSLSEIHLVVIDTPAGMCTMDVDSTGKLVLSPGFSLKYDEPNRVIRLKFHDTVTMIIFGQPDQAIKSI